MPIIIFSIIYRTACMNKLDFNFDTTLYIGRLQGQLCTLCVLPVCANTTNFERNYSQQNDFDFLTSSDLALHSRSLKI